MPKNDSYKPRAGIQCHFLDDCQYTPCWGLVAFGSSGIYTCEGHRGVDAEGVGVYRLEPPKPPPAPEPEPEVLPGEYLPEPGSEKPMAVPTAKGLMGRSLYLSITFLYWKSISWNTERMKDSG